MHQQKLFSILFSALILFPIFASAVEMKFKVSPWVAVCKDLKPVEPSRCGIPSPIGESFNVTIDMAELNQPGSAKVERKLFSSTAPANINGELSLFSVYPELEKKIPAYIQLQLELIYPVRVRCMQSVRLTSPMKFPPLICSHISDTREVGLTIQYVHD
jgi:hypothetical protein